MKQYKYFSIENWAAETLASLDAAIEQGRADMEAALAANNKKWAEREAMRERMENAHGKLIGSIMYLNYLNRQTA